MFYGQPSFQVPWREGGAGAGFFPHDYHFQGSLDAMLKRDHHALPAADAENIAKRRIARTRRKDPVTSIVPLRKYCPQEAPKAHSLLWEGGLN